MSPLLSVSIALLCSFLLGLGDSCFNTQLYSILGRVYAEDSMPAFAIFKFVQVTAESKAPPPSPSSLPPGGSSEAWLSISSRRNLSCCCFGDSF